MGRLSQQREPEKLPEPVQPELPFISEGTAKEIEQRGWAIDPRTGQRIGPESLPESRR